MRVLLDTHLLIWVAANSPRLPGAVADLLKDPNTVPMFSALSIAEVTIKCARGKPDFTVDAAALRRGLLDNGYAELPLSGAHGAAVAMLPPLHRDPFDRMLIAQARIEGVVLLTADTQVAAYGAGVRLV